MVTDQDPYSMQELQQGCSGRTVISRSSAMYIKTRCQVTELFYKERPLRNAV